MYVLRHRGGAPIAFVPHPDQAGLWLRVAACVVFQGCPHCGSLPGIPCTGKQGYGSSHHYMRSRDFRISNVERDEHTALEVIRRSPFPREPRTVEVSSVER